MEATADELSALAARLSSMAADLAANKDPQKAKMQKMGLIMEAKKTIWQLQDPISGMIDYVVSAYTNGSILALLKIGVFDAIPLTGTASIKEIAEKCQAEESIIIRLMRQLVCVNIFDEVKLNEWSHNKRSIGLSSHASVSGPYFFTVALNEMYPSMQNLHLYIDKYGKKDIHTYTETPHSWQSDMLGKSFFDVITSTPERFHQFNTGLSMFESMHPTVAIFPFLDLLTPGNSADRPLAVDIGGGLGQAMLDLRTTFPSLQGELILQERAVVLDQIPAAKLPGVTKMAHDFFTPQPVKGAQVYYIRRVMHDWQNEDAARILAQIRPAMAIDSRVLISDMVVPEPVTPEMSGAVWLDLMMMTIGGKERTASDWQVLAELSGLKLVKVWMEPERWGPIGMVEYMLPDADGQ